MPGGRRQGNLSISSGASSSQIEDNNVSLQPPKKKPRTKKTPAPRTTDGKIILSTEDSIWFGHPDVSQLVSSTIRSNFNICCPTWKKTPAEVREKWWNFFKGNVTYLTDPELEVKNAFYDKAKERLRDILHYTNTDGDMPKWMPPSSFAELKAYRQTENFKKLSESGKANRAKYAIDDKIPGTHNMGSISGVELAERMVRDDKDGTIPTAFQLFIKAHTHNGKLADKKAEEIKEKYETKKAQLEENGDEVNEDELFMEVVGGFQKGRLYGIGSAAEYYFNKSAYSKTLSEPSSATSYIGTGVLSKVATATAKLLEENAKLKEENEKLKETTNARFQDSNEKMLKMQEELRVLSATCSQLSQFQRDSHEDVA